MRETNHSDSFKVGNKGRGTRLLSQERDSLPTGFSKLWNPSLEMPVAIFDMT